MDLLMSMVDVLAVRYGWGLPDILNGMYWEELVSYYVMASNLTALEDGNRKKFDFYLHAQSQEAVNSWEDPPIPFPDMNIIEEMEARPPLFPQFVEKDIFKVQGTSEDRKRFEEVSARLKARK